MPEPIADPWVSVPAPATASVPARYRGVWRRTLLQTPEGVDDSTWVRWMQLGHWHADLRIPHAARAGMPAQPAWPYAQSLWPALRQQQGFAGVTQVETGVGGEICTWHRLVDYQPPGPHPDAGHMSFETTERVIEIGVHGIYREVWERLPGSTGRCLALAEPTGHEGQAATRLFVAGRYLMRVRPCAHPWQPAFEISFGVLENGAWHIEQSTRPELQGRRVRVAFERTGLNVAGVILGESSARHWRMLEWDDEALPGPRKCIDRAAPGQN